MSKLNYPYQFRNGKQLHSPNICLSPSLSPFNHKPLYQPDHIMHTQENTRTNKRDQLACGGISSERLCNGGSLRVSFLFLSFFFVHQLNCKKKQIQKKRRKNKALNHPNLRFLAVFKPVVLQIGQRFFCFSHSFMHWPWNSCPHSNVPMSSPSEYSSYTHQVSPFILNTNKNNMTFLLLL